MRRRDVLRTSATVGLAGACGCLGSGSDDFGTDGDDDDPIDADPEALLLTATLLEERAGGEWREADEAPDESPMHDADAKRQYLPYDEDGEFDWGAGIVTSGAWVYDGVSTSRDAYDDLPYHEGWEFDETDIAVESVVGTVDTPLQSRVLFRDANAIGAIVYQNGGMTESQAIEKGLEFAATMHRSWREP